MSWLPRCIAAVALAGVALGAGAQPRKDSVVLALAAEPAPGLDPVRAVASSVAEVVHYNVLEGLTKVEMDGRVVPLLAESWTIDPDGRVYTFTLRRNVAFHDGEAFDASDVKFSLERARAAGEADGARRTVFDNIGRIVTPDPHTVLVLLDRADGSFLFRMAESAAVMLDPKSAAHAATRPVGTGPFRFERWDRGESLTLVKNESYRNAASVRLRRATFRFIADPAAQAAALDAGEIDAVPRFGDPQRLRRLQDDPRFAVSVGGTSGKTLLALNHRRKPFDDVRVRRAIAAAIDRKALIAAAQGGLAAPIGSHMTPSDAGYVDLTAVNPYDPAKAAALLREAGVELPLAVTLTLPPTAYARRGGPVIAAQLARVGIAAKIENVDWAQWLAGPFRGRFDLTVVSHVEPLDFRHYADPTYYWGYDSASFRSLLAEYDGTADARTRMKVLADLQRHLAHDAAQVYLFQLPQFTVAHRRLKGLWSSSPVPANDLSALSWQ